LTTVKYIFQQRHFELKQNLDTNADENVSQFCIFTAAAKNLLISR